MKYTMCVITCWGKVWCQSGRKLAAPDARSSRHLHVPPHAHCQLFTGFLAVAMSGTGCDPLHSPSIGRWTGPQLDWGRVSKCLLVRHVDGHLGLAVGCLSIWTAYMMAILRLPPVWMHPGCTSAHVASILVGAIRFLFVEFYKVDF